MKIKGILLFVEDIKRELIFYTEVLGFVQTGKFMLHEEWEGKVLNSEDRGICVCLAPVRDPAGFKNAVILSTEDCIKEYSLLKSKGIKFSEPPGYSLTGLSALFSDSNENHFIILEERDYAEQE